MSEAGMEWAQKTVIRILLLVARMLSPDWQEEIKNLSNHIGAFRGER